MARLSTVSDLSYAWEIVNDYISSFHERIRRDPRSVVLLRATFLKLVSILDVPLTRVLASESPDFESVADYYSGELVALVRRVLEVIPGTCKKQTKQNKQNKQNKTNKTNKQ